LYLNTATLQKLGAFFLATRELSWQSPTPPSKLHFWPQHLDAFVVLLARCTPALVLVRRQLQAAESADYCLHWNTTGVHSHFCPRIGFLHPPSPTHPPHLRLTLADLTPPPAFHTLAMASLVAYAIGGIASAGAAAVLAQRVKLSGPRVVLIAIVTAINLFALVQDLRGPLAHIGLVASTEGGSFSGSSGSSSGSGALGDGTSKFLKGRRRALGGPGSGTDEAAGFLMSPLIFRLGVTVGAAADRSSSYVGKNKADGWDVIIDGGCFNGVDYTLPGFLAGYDVYAFEFSPDNQPRVLATLNGAQLKEGQHYTVITVVPGTVPNVPKMPSPHIYFFKAGLSNVNGGFSIRSNPNLSAGEAMEVDTASTGPGALPVLRLDSVIPPNSNIYIFKLDVQG
jgi:hypothetical protein